MFGTTSSNGQPQDTTSGAAPREPITVVGDSIASGASDTYTFEMPEGAILGNMRLHCYEGQEFDLQYRVTLTDASDRSRSLVNDIAGVGYLAGNDDVYELPIRREVSAGDVITVEVSNVDANGNDYTTNLVLDVDYDNTLVERVARTLGRVV